MIALSLSVVITSPRLLIYYPKNYIKRYPRKTFIGLIKIFIQRKVKKTLLKYYIYFSRVSEKIIILLI
jgi:hypothetical protein